MDVFVTNTLTWRPSEPWTPDSCHLHGRLSDGREVEVLTHSTASGLDSATRVAARHAWWHDRVLVAPASEGGTPRLVVPLDRLTPLFVGEALRRWLLGLDSHGDPGHSAA